MGIPEEIALFIKKKTNINHFVETGTFRGGTAVWASQNFAIVDTIEFSEKIYRETCQAFRDVKNINFILGDSRLILKQIINKAINPILFWLDAHWCSLGSYGEKDQCPLLAELEIINASAINHFILIDDARLFMAPPPLPNLISHYPDINKIISRSPNKFLTIYEDVIFLLPHTFEEEFSVFLQEKTTKDWESYGERINFEQARKNQSKIKKSKNLMIEFLKTWKLK